MRDILDSIVESSMERGRSLSYGNARKAELRGKRIDRLLSIARERIAAGDECASPISYADTLARHAAAVKACEEEVSK